MLWFSQFLASGDLTVLSPKRRKIDMLQGQGQGFETVTEIKSSLIVPVECFSFQSVWVNA